MVLNVWSNHDFTYDRDVADHAPLIVKAPKHIERLIASTRFGDERTPYSEMLPLQWDAFKTALEQRFEIKTQVIGSAQASAYGELRGNPTARRGCNHKEPQEIL